MCEISRSRYIIKAEQEFMGCWAVWELRCDSQLWTYPQHRALHPQQAPGSLSSAGQLAGRTGGRGGW